MSDREQKWFVAERTRMMALVHLTRRKDLTITEAGKGIGLDLIVSVATADQERSLRQFGVFLRGTISPVSEEQLNKALRPTMESFQRLGQFPYPVVLFHFTMEGDRGDWTWVAEPQVVEDNPRLLMHCEAHGRVLDRAALDEIVERVGRWYDAFFGRIAVKAS
jgi:hypothetical protein